MSRRIWSLFLASLVLASARGASAAPDLPAVLLVVGAPGEPAYYSNCLEQVTAWSEACRRTGSEPTVIGLAPAGGETADREQLERALAAEKTESARPLWLVLLGHGTFDGHDARFNLRGPDLTAAELAGWLQPLSRPLVVVDTSSASAPFVQALSATNRVVITATRSGNEVNYARFGRYFAQALLDPASDLDQDGSTSLLEVFLHAAHGVADFYKAEGRLATEHALIDDNGDRLGTPADWFRGTRSTRKPEGGAAVDGRLARRSLLSPDRADAALTPAQRAERDRLEAEVEKLRDTKAERPLDDYYAELERILLQLARLGTPRAQ